MSTISARTINEIFINNLIKISVSLHAGTSSLTYAYGTPNHLIKLSPQYRIPFGIKDGQMINSIIDQYYNGSLDNLPYNEATEPPDNIALEGINYFF